MELKRLNVYLEAAQLTALKRMAKQRHMSASGLVIEAVRFLLRNPGLFMPVSYSHTVESQHDAERESVEVA